MLWCCWQKTIPRALKVRQNIGRGEAKREPLRKGSLFINAEGMAEYLSPFQGLDYCMHHCRGFAALHHLPIFLRNNIADGIWRWKRQRSVAAGQRPAENIVRINMHAEGVPLCIWWATHSGLNKCYHNTSVGRHDPRLLSGNRVEVMMYTPVPTAISLP